jgi:hypothetical protein
MAKILPGITLVVLLSIAVSPAFAQFKYQSVPGDTSAYTSGAFSISDAGFANYTISLVIFPRSSGIQPQLALSYGSNGNNGVLGIGWILKGLSAITRASRTIAQDGMIAGISLSASDRFALYGKRPVTDGLSVYGGDGSQYLTERNTFSQIISYDSTLSRGEWQSHPKKYDSHPAAIAPTAVTGSIYIFHQIQN